MSLVQLKATMGKRDLVETQDIPYRYCDFCFSGCEVCISQMIM